MKYVNQKILVFLFVSFTCHKLHSQATNGNTANNIFNSNYFLGWSNTNGANPLFTKTNGINRMRLNGTQTEVISLVPTNTSGFLGLSDSPFFSTNSPWAMLHLEGPNNTPFTGGQWRTWMKTGLFMRENSDGMYVGMKQETGTNRSDAVVSWSDDALFDRLRFLFTTTAINGNGDNASPLHGSNLTGYEFMRMEANGPLNEVAFPTGQIAIGPLTAPQNRLHMNMESALPNFLQITNVGTNGTGQTGSDGLKLGVQNAATVQTGFLQWQEVSPFIIQSDWNAAPGGVTNGERMRISSTSAQGVPSTLMNFNNTTRVSINYLGNFPITQPRALLHLGSNTNGGGYATFMDYGTLTSTSDKTIFTGITPTNSTFVDPSQAIVGFGNSNLIFASSGQGEAGRFALANNYLAVGNYGATGLATEPTERIDVDGNGRFRDVPALGGESLILGLQVGTTPDDVKLSRLEFPMDNTQVLLGDGTWGTNPSGGNGFALCTQNADLLGESHTNLNDFNLFFENGPTQTVNQNLVAFGYDCGSALDAKLNVFSTKEVWSGSFFVDGANPATAAQAAFQGGVKSIIDNTNSESANAVYGYVAPNLLATMISQVGVKGEVDAFQAKEAIGVFGDATISDPTGGALGGRFLSSGSGFGRAVQAQNTTFQTTVAGTGFGFGGDFSCGNPFGTSVDWNTGVVGSANGKAGRNYGVLGRATGNGILNVGVYGEASGGVTNRAAYFAGQVEMVGAPIIISDQQFKTNVAPIQSALSTLSNLNPKTYYMDTANFADFHFGSELQYGFIAQEVQNVLPELVHNGKKPALYDSLGNEISPSLDYIALNYNALIPLNTQAINELNSKVASKDSVIDLMLAQNAQQQEQINDLNERLKKLESCLLNILPQLCEMNQAAIQLNSEEVQTKLSEVINVRLSDKNTIILSQNVPNPFAESTVINYSIPATVGKAQIHFYDGQGKLINSVEITSRGAGQLNVFGEDLSSGTYTYTLVADGQIVSTKKMLKE